MCLHKMFARRKMQQAVERTYHELSGVRTGRASPTLLDSIAVDAYGERTALHHLATITMRGPRTIGVTVYDKGLSAAVVEAVRQSPLQLHPRQEGGDVLVPVPECVPSILATIARPQACESVLAHVGCVLADWATFSMPRHCAWCVCMFGGRRSCADIVGVRRMSPETQRAMVKLAHQIGEQSRINVRQLRHKAMTDIKRLSAGGSEDVRKQQEKAVDELTKRMVQQVDDAVARKEAELTL